MPYLFILTAIFSSFFACGADQSKPASSNTTKEITSFIASYTVSGLTGGATQQVKVEYSQTSGNIVFSSTDGSNPNNVSQQQFQASEAVQKEINSALYSLNVDELAASYISDPPGSGGDGPAVSFVFSGVEFTKNVVVDTIDFTTIPSGLSALSQICVDKTFLP